MRGHGRLRANRRRDRYGRRRRGNGCRDRLHDGMDDRLNDRLAERLVAWPPEPAGELGFERRQPAGQRPDLERGADAAHAPDGDGRSKDEKDGLDVHATGFCNASAPTIHEYRRQPAASAGNARM